MRTVPESRSSPADLAAEKALWTEFSVLGIPVQTQPSVLRGKGRVGQRGKELSLLSMNYLASWSLWDLIFCLWPWFCEGLWFCEGTWSREKAVGGAEDLGLSSSGPFPSRTLVSHHLPAQLCSEDKAPAFAQREELLWLLCTPGWVARHRQKQNSSI